MSSFESSSQFEKNLPSEDSSLIEKSLYFDGHPNDIQGRYMNNFYLWMPGSPYIRQFDRFPNILDKKREDPTQLHTELWNSKTPREFLADVADVFQKIHIGDNFQNENAKHATPAEKNDVLIPVYLELRHRGYSHYDLVQ